MTRCLHPIFALLLTACPAPNNPAGDEVGTETDSDTRTTGETMPGESTSDVADSTGAEDDTTVGDDDDDDDGDDDDTETTGPAACAGGNRCVTAIPDSWLGPVARYIIGADDRLPECGGAFEDTEPLTPYSGLQAEPFECDCECAGNGLSCGGSARVRISHEQVFAGQSPCDAGNGGAGGLLSVTVSSGVPQTYAEDQVPFDSGDHGMTVDMVDIGPTGACDAMPTEVSSPATWTSRSVICGGQETVGVCPEDEVCVPDPANPYVAGVCIYRPGAWVCPEGYPNRELSYGSMDDDRDCSTCTCGEIAGACGASTVDVVGWNNAGGMTNPETLNAPNNFCQAVDAFTGGAGTIFSNTMVSIASITLDPGGFTPDDAAAPCPPAGGQPEGSAVGADPVTVCCTD